MKHVLQTMASFALMLAFLYGAFHNVEPGALWESARRADWFWLSAVVAAIVATTYLRAWRWLVLLRPISTRASLTDAMLALAMCYSANVAVPRAGEAVRAWSLKARHGVSVSAIFGTIVVERVIDLLCLIACIAASVAILPGRIEQTFPWMRAVTGATFLSCLVAIAGIVVLAAYGDRGLAAVRRWLGRLPESLAVRVMAILEQFVHGLSSVRTPSAIVEVVVSSALLNLGYILIIHWVFFAFGFDGPTYALGFGAAVVIMAISTIGVVIPTPGGAGSYHYFFGHTLTVLFGVAEAESMASATVAHALGTLTYLVIGVPAFFLRHSLPVRGATPRAADTEGMPA